MTEYILWVGRKEYQTSSTIILDNNSTPKDKLRRYLAAELFTSGLEEQITVEFIHIPADSPDFNLVEYIIHLLRLRLLHHLPIGMTIEQVKMRILEFFETQQLQSPLQIANTIQHTAILNEFGMGCQPPK